jgi:hypothetical protein
MFCFLRAKCKITTDTTIRLLRNLKVGKHKGHDKVVRLFVLCEGTHALRRVLRVCSL